MGTHTESETRMWTYYVRSRDGTTICKSFATFEDLIASDLPCGTLEGLVVRLGGVPFTGVKTCGRSTYEFIDGQIMQVCSKDVLLKRCTPNVDGIFNIRLPEGVKLFVGDLEVDPVHFTKKEPLLLCKLHMLQSTQIHRSISLRIAIYFLYGEDENTPSSTRNTSITMVY
jgi:hypothetical protein